MAITLEILRKKYKGFILKTAEENGLSNVRIFGSVARGEATKNSDLDLLVSTKPQVTFFDLSNFRFKLAKKLGLEVQVVTEKSLNKLIRKNVHSDIVLL